MGLYRKGMHEYKICLKTFLDDLVWDCWLLEIMLLDWGQQVNVATGYDYN